MSINLSPSPNEEGTGVFSGEFRDCLKNLVTPLTAKYSLSDLQGNIINGIDKEDITDFTSSWQVVLTGDDLKVPSASVDRAFTVFITYNSSLGTGLTENEEGKFSINNLAVIK